MLYKIHTYEMTLILKQINNIKLERINLFLSRPVHPWWARLSIEGPFVHRGPVCPSRAHLSIEGPFVHRGPVCPSIARLSIVRPFDNYDTYNYKVHMQVRYSPRKLVAHYYVRTFTYVFLTISRTSCSRKTCSAPFNQQLPFTLLAMMLH